MKSITFTNNLSSELMDWMETYAIRNKLTRRAIIKSAERFEKIRSPKGIRRIFQTGILGSEMKSMTEDGMGTISRNLKF